MDVAERARAGQKPWDCPQCPVDGSRSAGISAEDAARPQKRASAVNSDPLGVRIKAMVERYNRRASQDLTTDMTYWVLLYGREFGINPALVAALIARESSFNPDAVSSSGAQGLGQLTPATAKDLGVENAFDPDENIRGTAKYLAQLHEIWKDRPDQTECVLASYLVGHRVVRANDGVPPIESVQNFVRQIVSDYQSLIAGANG